MTTLINGQPIGAYLAGTPAGFEVPATKCKTCRYPMRSDGTGCTGPRRHKTKPAEILMYASRTSTRVNLHELHKRGMRLLAAPGQLSRYRGSVPPLAWALDNGAWSCFKNGLPFDVDAFLESLDNWGDGADWIVLPDIVCGGEESLALSLRWVDRVRPYRRLMLLAVQDGMTADQIRPHVGPDVGLFVGGSTDVGGFNWKERSLPMWGELAKEVGCHLHVARVNTPPRIRKCIEAGADSCDGTSLTRFSCNAEKLDVACRTPEDTRQSRLFASHAGKGAQ